MDYNEQSKLARKTLDEFMEQLNDPERKIPADKKIQVLTLWYLADIASTLDANLDAMWSKTPY